MGIGGQHFPHRVLKLPPGLDAPANILDPVLGNVLDVLLALHHESERPDRMAGAVGAMAGGLAAAEMRSGQGAGEEIVGKLEPPHQFELALAESAMLADLWDHRSSYGIDTIRIRQKQGLSANAKIGKASRSPAETPDKA